MFSVGDKVVYPMHGAGIIEAIEEKEILGVKQKYYVLRMPIGDMKVLIPIKNTQEIGIREIISTEEADRVFDILSVKDTTGNSNWNKRYRENLDKIKSGNIFEVADVVKSLVARENERGLSTGEKKMLINAKKILISELVLVKNTDSKVVEEKIDEFLAIKQDTTT